MYTKDEVFELLIDDEYLPILPEGEAEQLKAVYKKFIESYISNRDVLSVEEWLSMELRESLPEYPENEGNEIRDQIVTTLKANEANQMSLSSAIQNGSSKESWFASVAKKFTSHMSTAESVKYLYDLDNAVKSANESLSNVLTTQSGNVSQNPNLDGFIGEGYHAQTLNLNAQARGSKFRAKVLQPDGKGYTKNSVDIVIKNANGKNVGRYQSKYGIDSESTLKLFKKGDYRGQRKLVPDGQEGDIPNSTNVLEAPDGTTSNPLSKRNAKVLQKEAQSGQWNELNWNEYKAKDLAIGIGKQAGYAALLGAAIGSGFYIVEKVRKGEKINGGEIIEIALTSGADSGIKAAVAGALKVGVEKGLIGAIPKGTSAGTIASIAFIAVEYAKILVKVATGEITVKEGIEKMEQTTIVTLVGMAFGFGALALIGGALALIGSPLALIGGPTTFVGFIVFTIGYMVGSSIADKFLVKGMQMVSEAAKIEIKERFKEYLNDISQDAANWINLLFGSVSEFIAYAPDLEVIITRIDEMQANIRNLRQSYLSMSNAVNNANLVVNNVYNYYNEPYVRSCCREIQFDLKNAEKYIQSVEGDLDRMRRVLFEAVESYRKADQYGARLIREKAANFN